MVVQTQASRRAAAACDASAGVTAPEPQITMCGNGSPDRCKIVWLVLDLLVLITLYVVLGRVLDPLQSLSRGMRSLEDGHYGTRLAEPKVKELALITNRFNRLSGALDTAHEENSRLYQQLISVQEQERQQIAQRSDENQKSPRHEKKPARAVHQKEPQRSPAVAKRSQVRRVIFAAVGFQRDWKFGNLCAEQAGGEAPRRSICLAEFAQDRRDYHRRFRCAGRAR
jgi:HAMP domain-containing protein